jgi:hypothetical protein
MERTEKLVSMGFERGIAQKACTSSRGNCGIAVAEALNLSEAVENAIPAMSGVSGEEGSLHHNRLLAAIQDYLHQYNGVAYAGVGIDFAGRHPFTIRRLRAGGPAEKIGVIKVGDMLEEVDHVPLQRHLTGDQVRALVIGPKDSVVELHFRENPKRTPPGAYHVRLIRQPAQGNVCVCVCVRMRVRGS